MGTKKTQTNKKNPSLIMFQDQDYNLVAKSFHDMHEIPCVIHIEYIFEHGLTMVN